MTKPQVTFEKPNLKAFEVEPGAPLMKSLLAQGVPVASSCHGDGVCGKCRVRVVEGAQSLSPISEHEKFLMERLKLQSPWRISCQAQILGDVKLDTGYW